MGAKLAAIVTALTLLCCCACGGGASLQHSTQPNPPFAPGQHASPPADNALAPPGGMPAMPGGEPDAESRAAPRVVAGAAYQQDGALAWERSATGAEIQGSSLKLSSEPESYTFGIWRWMGFFYAVSPHELTLQTRADAGTRFWVLLADYSSQHWQVLGPCEPGTTTLYYDADKYYLSPAGNVYVAVIAEGGAEVTVDSLMLTPIGQAYTLQATEITSSSAKLQWYFPLLEEPPYPDIYYVYTGPEVGFQLADPGVNLLGNSAGFFSPTLTASGLSKATHYYWKVQPGYLVDGEYVMGPLCEETGEFTTLLSNPPVVYLYPPYYTMLGDNSQIDCMITDTDSPDDELAVSWDFESDGVIDQETQGSGIVEHIYAKRGNYLVTASVSDGVNTVSESCQTTVGFRYREEMGLYAGEPMNVVAYDRNLADNKAALLLEPLGIRVFNGVSWASISTWEQPDNITYCDVAGSPDCFLLSAHYSGPKATWGLSQYTYGWEAQWSWVDAGDSTSDTFFEAHMDLAANGLYSIVFAGGINDAPGYTGNLDVWHMQAGGAWTTGNVALDQDKYQACEVVRTDTETYFAYCKDSSVHLWRFDDAADTDTLEQSYNGDATDMVLESDPSMPGHVFWATLNGDRIYYGDNYGAANGADQYIAPPLAPTDLVAVSLAGDNQGLVFWTDEDASQIQHLYGCNTAQGGVPFEITSGYGAAQGGVGAFYGGISLDGVELVVDETRDGECTRIAVESGTIQSADQAAPPNWSKQVSSAIAVVQTGGGFWGLASQEYPSTLSMYAASLALPFTNSILGNDSWCGLACAAPANDGGLYIGSYLENGDLLLNHLDQGSTIGTDLASLPGTTLPRLIANRARTELHLFYLTNNATQIEQRTWEGSDWSPPIIVASGSFPISAYNVAPFADDSGWGLAYIDASPALRLCETAGGAWGAPQTLLSTPLNGGGGVALDYKTAAPAGDLLLAVTTLDPEHWLTAGVRPPGGSFNWTHCDPAPGTQNPDYMNGIGTFWQGPSAVVIAAYDTYGLAVFEYDGAQSFTYMLPPTLRGAPVGMAAIDGGGIVLTGAWTDSTNYRQKSVVLSP